MSQKSLLIVDDDQTMSDLIADTLETDFSDIDNCKSISAAKDMLLENSYDCIIVDIELEDGNGAEVVKYINDWDPGSNKDSVKVIISGLINDAFKEKFKDKFDGILSKPFKPGDLQGAVLIAMGKRKKSKSSSSDLLLETDEKKEEKVEEKKSEEKKTDSKPSLDLKLEVGDDEEINLKVFDPEIHAPFKIQDIEKRIHKTLNKVKNTPKLKELFKSIHLDPSDSYIMAHIGLLINISVGISKHLDWASEQTLEKFIFAAYLHDLALGPETRLAKIDDLSVLEIKDHEFTKEEIDLIKYHPSASKKLIEHKSGIPSDVLTLIEQHHELPNGQGFPRGIEHKRITPLSSVFIVSHWLTDFIINNPKWTVDKFLSKYKSKVKGPHFRKAMKAIESLK
ncbi:MAG: response regulator [Bdellovibrionota bacterium]|nr:response regulator [Bdellovibrionota bacterium]